MLIYLQLIKPGKAGYKNKAVLFRTALAIALTDSLPCNNPFPIFVHCGDRKPHQKIIEASGR